MTQGYRLLRKPPLSIPGAQPAVRGEQHRQILEEEVALQGRNQGSGEGRPSDRVPLTLFSDSQEGRKPSASLGLKRPEPVSATPLVQNAHSPKP